MDRTQLCGSCNAGSIPAEGTRKMKLKNAILISLAFGAALGGYMVYVALQHNPQMEFFDPATHEIFWDNLLPIFFFWFVPATFIAFLPLGSLYLLGKVSKMGR